MAEYIELEVAFNTITDLAGKALTRSAYEAIWKSARMLKKIPVADVVPVVRCKNCKYFYKRPDITMFVCVKGKPHEDNTVIDCENYAPMTNADRIRSMTDDELADFLVTVESYGYHDQSISGTYEMNEWLRAESEGI